MKKKRRKWFILIPCLVLVAGAVVFLSLRDNTGAQYKEDTVKSRDIVTYYSFAGNISSNEVQNLVSKNGISIKQFYVKEGDTVAAGDKLYDLDASSMDANITQAEAGLEVAKINLSSVEGPQRDQQLSQANLAVKSAQTNYDAAKKAEDAGMGTSEATKLALDQLNNAKTVYGAAVKSSDNAIALANQQLVQAQATYDALIRQQQDLTVKAEVAGQVSKIYVSEGQSLALGMPILDVVNFNSLMVQIRVDEYDLAAVAEGKQADVTINALGKSIDGTIKSIAYTALTVGGVSFFPADVTIEADSTIRVGMSAEVRILNQQALGAPSLPMNAIRFDADNKPYVQVYGPDGKKVEQKYIEVGMNDGNFVEITGGLSLGDTVLIPRNSMRIGLMSFDRDGN